MRKTKTSHKLAAAMTAGMLAASGEAWAQAGANNAANVTAAVVESTATFTDAISLASYIGGTALSVAGVWKLKQHVDAPGQHPMKDGLMRLASGGALLALPFLTNVVAGSVGADGGEDSIDVNAMTVFTPGGP